MGTPRLAVTTEALALDPLIVAVSAPPDLDSEPGVGAVASFLGLVRGHNLGRRVLKLEYEAYGPLALKAFERIAAEVAEHWPEVRLALHHRTGVVAVGEVSVAIAASSPHRTDAFGACRYAIERVKQIAPIWKREFFEGGDVWIEGTTADPDDTMAREDAYRRSCV